MSSHDLLKEAHNLIEHHSKVFDGFGLIADNIELEIDDQVKPVIQTSRRFPLKSLVEGGIIIQEKEHTEWCSNILFPKRNDKRRLVLDPAILNTALKRPNYRLPFCAVLAGTVPNLYTMSRVPIYCQFFKNLENNSKNTILLMIF